MAIMHVRGRRGLGACAWVLYVLLSYSWKCLGTELRWGYAIRLNSLGFSSYRSLVDQIKIVEIDRQVTRSHLVPNFFN